jgi:hypothetical protein
MPYWGQRSNLGDMTMTGFFADGLNFLFTEALVVAALVAALVWAFRPRRAPQDRN